MNDKFNITILVAPLDWGLGHAARCIPLIRHLADIGCKVLIATDGPQKKLLQTEFPGMLFLDLSGYDVTYTRYKRFLPLKLLWQLPKIYSAIRNEQAWLQSITKKYHIHAIVSDNRYGLWHPKIPAVLITHQLNIQAPFLQGWVRKINYLYIKRFAGCWVPDVETYPCIAGELSHPAVLPGIPTFYLGGISRFEKRQNEKSLFDLLVVISGPEPQRSVLEQMLLKQLADLVIRVLFVRGLPSHVEKINSFNDVEIANHLSSEDLNVAFEQSEFIVSRSGYTTVMDILKLQKKSILIPTPGQTEQEYLARHLKNQQWSLSFDQKTFNLQQAIAQARVFPYKLPQLEMNDYEQVLDEFTAAVKKANQ